MNAAYVCAGTALAPLSGTSARKTAGKFAIPAAGDALGEAATLGSTRGGEGKGPVEALADGAGEATTGATPAGAPRPSKARPRLAPTKAKKPTTNRRAIICPYFIGLKLQPAHSE
jgi:hypothetical protein